MCVYVWVASGRGKGSFHVFALDFVVSADLQVGCEETMAPQKTVQTLADTKTHDTHTTEACTIAVTHYI